MSNNFLIDFQKTKLVGDVTTVNSKNNLICLHGGGGDRKRFEKMRSILAEKGIWSCAFDFIGHGETGGEIIGSSLKERVEQAVAVIDSQTLSSPISIIASSMGGYVAILLTKIYNVENLILIAPAVYTSKVYDVPFGLEFTKIIREPYSWLESDSWEILKNYKGNLLIISAEKDQIIPDEVIKKIYNSAQNTKSRKIIEIKEATHPLVKWLNENQEDLQEVSDSICKFISMNRITEK